MADGFSFDDAEMHKLIADLGKVGAGAVDAIDPIVEIAAARIKTGMVADAAGSRHFKRLAGAITYDRRVGRIGSIGAEIGPDKDRKSGAIGNIAYFGGVNDGGGTLDIDGPLRAEEPGFIKALGKALEDLL